MQLQLQLLLMMLMQLVPLSLLEQLQLLEGQDLGLISPEELLSGSIWSTKLAAHRPLADGLLEVMQHVLQEEG